MTILPVIFFVMETVFNYLVAEMCNGPQKNCYGKYAKQAGLKQCFMALNIPRYIL